MTRLSQLWKTVREDEVRCIALALGDHQPTAAVVRLAARLPDPAERAAARGGIGSGGALRLIVPGEFVIDRSHFKWHFIPGIEQYRG